MTTTNGWPGKPGVPRDPEKDGWHWLLAPDGEQFPCLWSVIGVSQRGRFPMGWISDPESWSPQECTYLGPVLTPDEAAALQKRVAELVEALDAASRVLHKAGEQFSEYAKQHAAKGTAVSDLKPDFNKQWAERCFSAYWRAAEGGKDE